MAGALNLEVVGVPGADAVNAVVSMRSSRPETTAFITSGGGLNVIETMYADRRAGDEQPPRAIDKVARRLKIKALTMAYGGAWPAAPTPNVGFLSTRDAKTGETLSQVYVAAAAVPQRTWWDVFPYLRFGGWNENPPANEHSRTMERWARRYGVELVGLTHDFVEVSVSKPPQTKHAALSLAEQHFYYCEDNLLQGAVRPGNTRRA